jgi:hypothetical protein
VWTAVVAVALSPLPVAAQEYAIKLRPPGLGDKAEVKHSDRSEVDFKILDNTNTAIQDKKETKAHKFAFREVGLERGTGDELVKIKRTYEHAERVIDGTRQTLPYQGKTLAIEKKNNQFEFRIEGEDSALDGKEAEELWEEFNKGDFRKLLSDPMLPRKAVKVGEGWKVDAGLLAKEFTKDGKIEIDDTKAKGSGKLVKAYQKDGKQYGIIELALEFPVTALTGDGNRVPTKEGKITIKAVREGPIDGSNGTSTLSVSFDGDIRAEFNANNMDLMLMIMVRARAEETRTPMAK